MYNTCFTCNTNIIPMDNSFLTSFKSYWQLYFINCEDLTITRLQKFTIQMTILDVYGTVPIIINNTTLNQFLQKLDQIDNIL